MRKIFIGDQLRQLRKERGLKQRQLSELTDIRQGFISELEANLKEPGAGTIVALASTLGVTTDQLLTGTPAHIANPVRVFSKAGDKMLLVDSHDHWWTYSEGGLCRTQPIEELTEEPLYVGSLDHALKIMAEKNNKY